MNTLRTGILMAALTGLFLAVGGALGGSQGMAIALAFALAANLFAYWNSDKVLLSMYGARQVDAPSAPDLYRLVEQLAAKAGLPMPRVYITDNPQPNAFATGRSPEHAAVCVTSGLLGQVNQEELAGVLAHELGHVKHRDTLTMTITAVMAGAISMLANMAFFMGGGRDRNNPLGIVGDAAGHAAGAHRRRAGAGGDFAFPRIRCRQGGCGDHRPALVAGERAVAHRHRRAADRQLSRRCQSRHRAYVHHQSAAWRAVGPVRQPSFDRGTRRALAGDGGRGCGARAKRTLGLSPALR